MPSSYLREIKEFFTGEIVKVEGDDVLLRNRQGFDIWFGDRDIGSDYVPAIGKRDSTVYTILSCSEFSVDSPSRTEGIIEPFLRETPINQGYLPSYAFRGQVLECIFWRYVHLQGSSKVPMVLLEVILDVGYKVPCRLEFDPMRLRESIGPGSLVNGKGWFGHGGYAAAPDCVTQDSWKYLRG